MQRQPARIQSDAPLAPFTAAASQILLYVSRCPAPLAAPTHPPLRRGYTACHVAAQYGQTAILYHLALKWNAETDELDNDGRTPLHWAAYKGFAGAQDVWRGRAGRGGAGCFWAGCFRTGGFRCILLSHLVVNKHPAGSEWGAGRMRCNP